MSSCASSCTASRRKYGSAPGSDLLSSSNSVILRFAIAVVLHVVLEHVTWNHTVAFLSKAFEIYTTTRDTTSPLAGPIAIGLPRNDSECSGIQSLVRYEKEAGALWR